MAAIALNEPSVAAVKTALAKSRPDVRSSHLTEALAAALRRRTHASLRADMARCCDHPPIEILDDERFESRLQELGYRTEPRCSFERLKAPGLVPTVDPRGHGIRYKSDRARAWRNMMVCGINAALDQKLFSLRPNDNRWPGAKNRTRGALFDFTMPNGLPARSYVNDAGYAEVDIHVAVNPKGDWVRTGNGGFTAGDAFAKSWLERQRGAWLQSATSSFNCRRTLVKTLASMTVEPHGYGDRGHVIL